MHRLVGIVMVALAGVVPARASSLTAQETRAAQKLYDVKCAKCHKFYNPADYSDQEWDTWMRKMTKKAKLKGAQVALLSKYLDTFREKSAQKQ